MTGKTVTQPAMHIHTNVQNNMNTFLKNCKKAELVKYANGKNAVKPPTQPGIHMPNTNPKNDVNRMSERISNNMRSMDVNMRATFVEFPLSRSIVVVNPFNTSNTLCKIKPPT